MTDWSFPGIPSQTGRVAIVTGTGGLGFETALVLTCAGGNVILAGRNADKGAAAVASIESAAPHGSIQFERLDLADLASVKAFSERMRRDLDRVDLLINNAGVMSPPTRRVTADGFELQFGTNYLGHFATTANLLPMLRRGRAPRVVCVSSISNRNATINFDDLHAERGYKPWACYGQSKLALLMFAFELQRRSNAAGWGLMSNAAHPGFARTELVANGPGPRSLGMVINRLLRPFLSQSAARGALPTLFAATSPGANASAYYGPSGFGEYKGPPKLINVPTWVSDKAASARLWEASEHLTSASFR
jgi:NAD(P)-dependent dehydrogenase (short-subunit alcohol dehydrogenase family)